LKYVEQLKTEVGMHEMRCPTSLNYGKGMYFFLCTQKCWILI